LTAAPSRADASGIEERRQQFKAASKVDSPCLINQEHPYEADTKEKPYQQLLFERHQE